MIRRRVVASAVVAVTVLGLALAGCGGGEEETTSSTIPVPSVEGPTTTAPSGATTAAAAPLPCDAQVLLDVMRMQGDHFELSTAVLAALTPIGVPKCDGPYASLSFNGPPDSPGPYGALFAPRPDRSAWEVFAVDCVTSAAAGRRQVC